MAEISIVDFWLFEHLFLSDVGRLYSLKIESVTNYFDDEKNCLDDDNSTFEATSAAAATLPQDCYEILLSHKI